MTRTILITGATAGIGLKAATHFAKKGLRVFATGRNEAALSTLRSNGIETVTMDVNNSLSVSRAHEEISRKTDRIDVLVNNAGYGLQGPIAEITDEDLHAQFETNVFGLMRVTRTFIPMLKESKDGRIVNISSVAGRMTFPLFGAYNASKYAVEALSNALRLELAQFGIRVIIIEPGTIRTEFAARASNELAKYRTANSDYVSIFDRVEKLKTLFQSRAPGPECVVQAIERGITARRPKARYVVPFSSRLHLALYALAPTCLQDFVMRRATGLIHH